uniref:HOOK_N domain-containing protein n=1 Tax=Caenorhabditis tropicalis TaxID=1561998 RepID=A0A1I7UH62_9PELO
MITYITALEWALRRVQEQRILDSALIQPVADAQSLVTGLFLNPEDFSRAETVFQQILPYLHQDTVEKEILGLLNDHAKDLKAEVRIMTKRYEKCQETMVLREKEAMEAAVENEELKDRLKALDEDNIEMKGKNGELKDRLKALDKDNLDLNSKNRKLRSQTESLEKDIVELKKENQELSNKNKDLKELDAENEKLENQLKTLTKEKDELKSELEGMRETWKVSGTLMNTMIAETSDLKKEIKQLEDEKKRVEAGALKLTQEVEKQRAAQRNIALELKKHLEDVIEEQNKDKAELEESREVIENMKKTMEKMNNENNNLVGEMKRVREAAEELASTQRQSTQDTMLELSQQHNSQLESANETIECLKLSLEKCETERDQLKKAAIIQENKFTFRLAEETKKVSLERRIMDEMLTMATAETKNLSGQDIKILERVARG